MFMQPALNFVRRTCSNSCRVTESYKSSRC